jgi:hypothetical protein
MLLVTPGFLRLVHQLSAPFNIWIIGRHTQDNKCQMAPSYYHSFPQVQAAFDVFFRGLGGFYGWFMDRKPVGCVPTRVNAYRLMKETEYS